MLVSLGLFDMNLPAVALGHQQRHDDITKLNGDPWTGANNGTSELLCESLN